MIFSGQQSAITSTWSIASEEHVCCNQYRPDPCRRDPCRRDADVVLPSIVSEVMLVQYLLNTPMEQAAR